MVCLHLLHYPVSPRVSLKLQLGGSPGRRNQQSVVTAMQAVYIAMGTMQQHEAAPHLNVDLVTQLS